MHNTQVVVNASPLITLFQAGLDYLLPELFGDVYVPQAIWDEIVNSGHTDRATQQLPNQSWVTLVEIENQREVELWNLGKGETEVLFFAFCNDAYSAILDDKAARRCANILNIHIYGTADIIVLAKRCGILESVEIGLRRLGENFRISESLVRQLILAED